MPYQSRPSLPARCASLPPLHLEFPSLPRAGLSTIPEEDQYFSWAHVPKEIQHTILRYALALPHVTRHDVTFGGREYKTHLLQTAVPIFLGLGNLKAYLEAASIMYGEVYITSNADKDALMKLLSSSETLRIRNLVYKLEMHINMPYDLKLFDFGLSDTHKSVSTALHSMRVHGRLHEVDFFFFMPDLQTCPYEYKCMTESDLHNILTLYLPMTRLQVVSSNFTALSKESSHGLSTFVSQHVPPGSVFIAPAFMASRAFQEGLLPLLEKGVFQKSSLTMKLFSTKDQSIVRDVPIDSHSVFAHWFGATKVEDLDEYTTWNLPKERPNDLYPFVGQLLDVDILGPGGKDGDETFVAATGSDDTALVSSSNEAVDGTGELEKVMLPIAGSFCMDTTEYQEHGDDLVSSPVRYPEMSSIKFCISPSSQEAVESLHSMITRTAAGVSGERDKSDSRNNGLCCQEEIADNWSPSSCGSDASCEHFSSNVEIVSSETTIPSDPLEIIDTKLTADAMDIDIEEMSVQVAPVVAALQHEHPTLEEEASKNLELSVGRNIIQQEQPVSHIDQGVGAKPAKTVINPYTDESSCDSESHNESSSDSDSDSDSSGDTVVGRLPRSTMLSIPPPTHTSTANEHPLAIESDSDSSDESSEEFPASRSAAFAKKIRTPSPGKIPLPTGETGSSSDDSSDDSSSENEGEPMSPTIEISRDDVQYDPIDCGSMVMTGALPSSSLSSSSSESDSEDSSDSSDVSLSIIKERMTSAALTQVGQVFEARAAVGSRLTDVEDEKVATPNVVRTISQQQLCGPVKEVDTSSSSSESSESEPDTSSSDPDSADSESDPDGSSSNSDDSESGSDHSGTEKDMSCPRCGKYLIPANLRKTTASSQAVNKIPVEPAVGSAAVSASQMTKPAPISIPSSQSGTARKKKAQSSKDKSPLRTSHMNNNRNTTPRPNRKRNMPPIQSADSPQLSRSQKNRRRRNMKRQKRQGQPQTAQQTGRR